MSQIWVGGEFEEARHINFRIENNQHIQKIIILILLSHTDFLFISG